MGGSERGREEFVGTASVSNAHLAPDVPPVQITKAAPGDDFDQLEPAHCAPEGSVQIGSE